MTPSSQGGASRCPSHAVRQFEAQRAEPAEQQASGTSCQAAPRFLLCEFAIELFIKGSCPVRQEGSSESSGATTPGSAYRRQEGSNQIVGAVIAQAIYGIAFTN